MPGHPIVELALGSRSSPRRSVRTERTTVVPVTTVAPTDWLPRSTQLAAGKAAAASVLLANPGLWLTGAERGLMLAGLSVALGGLAGRGLARQYKGSGPGPLPPPWALRGCLLGLLASAALLVTAVADPGLAANLAHPTVAGPHSSAPAVIAAIEAGCFAIAATGLRLRQPGWSVLPLLGVVLAEAIRAHPEGIIPVAGALLTVCHVLPAVLWAGMLLYTLRAAFAWRADPPAMQGLVRLYGNAAAWLVATVLLTGVISALLLVPLGSLLTTTYGRFLVVKAALVAIAICLAITGRRWLRSRPEPGTGPARATRLECATLAAVLAVTGLLTVLTPPTGPVYAAAVRAAARSGQHHTRPAARSAKPAGQP